MASQRAAYHHLRDKWTHDHIVLQQKIREKHKSALEWLVEKSQHAAVGSIGTFLLFALPGKQTLHIPQVLTVTNTEDLGKGVDTTNAFVISDLGKILPDTVQPLTENQEADISEVFSRYYGVKATASLQGKRLNTSYGYIGAEQHLVRFAGDTMDTHFASSEEATTYYSSGMAPGRGAWGYFGSDEKGVEREKYYIAVQTFLAPGWNDNSRGMSEFFKFRKMLIVNPQNGKAMVVVIGDSGPAGWTGKQLGGSPEVMHYLERVDGGKKGPVIYFFLDDPNDTIPLGPVQAKSLAV